MLTSSVLGRKSAAVYRTQEFIVFSSRCRNHTQFQIEVISFLSYLRLNDEDLGTVMYDNLQLSVGSR